MTEENVNKNEETQDETVDATEASQETSSETTDAPAGVADVENVPEEAAPESEPAAEPEPPETEPATEAPAPAAEASPAPEPEDVPQPVGDDPVAEAVQAEEEPAREAAEAVEEEPAAEEGAASSETPVSPEVELAAVPAAVSEPKKKKKRLPRALRSQRTKTKRERPAERKPIARLPKPEHARGRRQERQGKVVSAASDKTIVVRVDTAKVHPMYKKVIRRSTKLHAHDAENQAKIGDVVRIVETRPISKQKRWRLQEIVEAAK
ncbi:MAG: 30S ribosomal protein S17 [Actinobacteria bacterium]|nr:30S ribosomal protein S17 [Actinomycetota bacterium]MBA3567654.1 30S ribosomal protein S17 [Actinomycetota bacterium]